MRPSLPRPTTVLAALALLCAGTPLAAQKALVLCPPADAAGCERVAGVLAGAERAGGGPLFPGGVDRRFDDLRTADPAEMRAYSLVFVPSLAGAPYELLREAPVRERLGAVLTGRVAVWSGTPDRGAVAGAGAGKLELIGRLVRWAAAGGGPGLVVLQDFSDPRPDGTSRRYDWVRGIAGVEVAAAPVVGTYRGVKAAEGGAVREIVGGLAYENMASFGLAAPADPGAIRVFGVQGPGRAAAEEAVVLLAWDRGPSTSSVGGADPEGASATSAPSSIVVNAGADQTATAGSSVATPPSVRVTDAQGNPVAGVTVTFAVASGGGSITGATPPTGSNGVAAVGSWTLGTTAGPNSLNASVSGGLSVAIGATGIPGAASSLAITTQPSAAAQSGVAFTTQPVVQLRDQFGNPVAQSGVTVTAAIASGGGTLGGTATVTTNASGAATFTNLSISGAAGDRVLSFSAAGLTGVVSSAVNVSAGAPSQLTLNTQPSSTAQSGVAFAQQPVVQLRDASGNPISQAGVDVTAAIASGGGVLGGTTTATTNANGAATFTNLSISGVVGDRTLSFSAAGLVGATSSTIGVTAGPATQMVLTTQPSAAAQSGVAFTTQPVVQLRDQFGNPVAQSGVTVTAAIASGGGTLGGTATVTTNASGTATFTDLSISGAAGDRVLAFSAAGLTGVVSSAVNVSAGAPSQLTLNTQPSSTAQSGVAFAQQPVVQLRDASGNPISQAGVTVTAAVASGGGTLGGTTTATTNANGAATFTNLSISGVVGDRTLSFSAAGLVGATSSTISVTAGPATQMVLTTQPSAAAQSGVAFTTQPVVQLRDQFGNPVAQSGVTVTAAIASGGGTLGGTATVTTNASGAATFTDLSISGAAGDRVLSFSAAGLTGVASSAVNVAAGAPSQLTLNTQPSPTAQSGVAFAQQPVVQLRDASGNAAPQAGVTVTAAIASGGGTLGGTTTATTNASGAATFTNLSIGGAVGDRTLSFSAGALTGATSGTVSVTAGAAAALAFSVQPSSGAANAPITPAVQVSVVDAYGNLVTGATNAVTLAIGSNPSGATLSGTATVAAAGGVATFSGLGIDLAGAGYTLTASAAGLSGATSAAFNVSPGNDAPAAVGDAFSTDEDVPLFVAAPGVLGNDTDPEGSPLTAVLVSGPAHGTLTLNANGSFTYTPVAGYNGPDSFTYKANDGTSDSNVATVTITVATVNDAPTAVGDAYSTDEDVALVVAAPGVLGNDTDPEGSPFTAVLVSGPAHGTLTLNANGSFIYTPASGYSGTDQFTYKANDGTSDSNVATVTITVATVNDAPTAVGDAYSTDEDVALVVAAPGVLGNDTDPEGSPLTAVLVSGPAHGTLTLNANGSFTYTPVADYNGSDSFTYKANDGTADSNVATTSITVNGVVDAPTAVGDAYSTDEDTPLVVAAPGVLGNDTDPEGSPLTAVLVSGPAHGTLTLYANGAFTYTPVADYNGPDSFTYKANDGTSDSNTATVSLTVSQAQAPPTAVNDGPASGSAPGQPFHAFFNTNWSLPAPGVLANDDPGFPAATITSFGADSLGGSVTTYAAGSTTPLPGHASGSLSVGADGAVAFTPPVGFTGNYVFRYRVSNARGTSDAQVTIAVGARPAAASDTYSPVLVGNVPISTATSTQFQVTANDAGDGTTLALVAQSNGTATLNADGTFAFRPTRGFEGTASFSYTVTNGFGTSAPATVTMTVASPVWFVDAAAAPGGDGSYDARFNALSGFASINNGTGSNPAANDRVFLYSGSYTGSVTLLNGQRLVGQGATGSSFGSVTGVTWPADSGAEPSINGTPPTITSATAGITLGSGNTLRGFNLGSVGAGSTALSGTGFGTLAVSEVGINTGGRALSLTTGTLAGSFTQLRSTGGANNVFLSGVATAGTATLGSAADALSGATGDALRIAGGAGSFTYPGSITNTAALAVNVTGRTGGTVTLSGPINPAAAARGISISGNTGGTVAFTGSAQKISTGAAPGVSLVGNAGATVAFTGGGLEIATTTGGGFSATGGGTVTVTGAANTITSAGGVALNVAGTAIGAGGLVFRSISATGGSSGIVLNATGSAGGLAVTGSGGGAGSGGTIQNTTGDAVSLTGTVNPALSYVSVRNNAGSGIRASAVSGLSVSGSLVENNGDTAGGTEAGIFLANLSGASQIVASTIRGSFEDNVRWTPSAGAQTLTLTGTTVGPNNPTSGSNGVSVVGSGTAVATLSVSGGSFTQNRSFGIGTSFTGGAAHTVNVSGATFTDNNVAIGLATAQSADVTFDIADNPGILRSRADAIQVVAGAASTSASQLRGRIRGNAIGDGTADSGSRDGVGIRVEVNDDADAVVEVTGNVIRHTDRDGIFIQSRDPNPGDGDPATAAVDLTVTGNTVGTPDDNSAFPVFSVFGIRVEGRHGTATCLDLAGNTSSAVGVEHFQLRQRDVTSTFRLERYAGSGTSDAAVAAFVRAENAYAGVTAAATHQGPTGFTGVAAGTCRMP